jgi:phage terminase small subunit
LNSKTTTDRRIIKEFEQNRQITIGNGSDSFSIEDWCPIFFDCLVFNRVTLVEYLIQSKFLAMDQLVKLADFFQMVEINASRKRIGLEMLEVLQPYVTFTKKLLDVYIEQENLDAVTFIVQQSKNAVLPDAANADEAYSKGNIKLLQWIMETTPTVRPTGSFIKSYFAAVAKADGKPLSAEWRKKETCIRWLAENGKIVISANAKARAEQFAAAAQIILSAKPYQAPTTAVVVNNTKAEEVVELKSNDDPQKEPLIVNNDVLDSASKTNDSIVASVGSVNIEDGQDEDEEDCVKV